MAINMRRGIKPAGRPMIAADFNSSNDKAIERQEAFFNLCQTFSYQDKVHIANGLGITLRTVENWYYGETMPDEQIRDDIINWNERGKPLKKLLPCDSPSGY